MDKELDSSTPMVEKRRTTNAEKCMQYVAALTVSLGALCAGSVLAWTSPALPQLKEPADNTTNITSSFTITSSEEATIGSMVTIGALIAAVPIGYLADKIGRKNTIILLAVSFIVNWALIIFAQSAWVMVIARFFAGIGLGGSCVMVPMYIGEIAEASLRGVLSTFFQVFLCLGILITFVVGGFTSYITLSLVLCVFPVLLGIAFVFMPETPVYLSSTNQDLKAESSLRKLRGKFYHVESEMKEIKQELEERSKKSGGFQDIIGSKSNRKAVIAILGVMAYQQLCGINAVIFYTVPIFQAAGSSLPPIWAAIIISLVQTAGGIFSIFIIEKAPRKFFLMLSAIGMFLCLSALGLYFHLQLLKISITGLGYIPLGSSVLFMICFTVGFGTVPYMLLFELLPPEIKGVASGVAIISNWASAFLVTFFFPLMIGSLGSHVTFYIFGAVTATGIFFVYFLVPETKGKTLAEIHQELNKN